ncbi:hypothetical protein D3C81_1190440 [compost metagenome]
MGDDRHEVIAHAHRVFQFAAGHLQLRQQQFLFFAAAFESFQLLAEGLALAKQVDEHRHLAFHRQAVQRLVQEVHRAAFVALEGVVHLAPGGADKDNRDILGLLGAAHQLGQFEAVHAGHLHVEDSQGELVLEQQCQGLVGGLSLVHLAVFALDQRVQGQQVLRQVVDDQQFCMDVA